MSLFMASNESNEHPKTNGEQKKRSPMENANIFSLLFFWWMNDTLKLGSKRPLQGEDLFPLQDEFKTEVLVKKLEAEWYKENDSCVRSNKRPRLWKVMFRMFSYKKYFVLATVKLINSLSTITLPVMVWFFLKGLSDGANVNITSITLRIIGIFVVTIVKGISHHHAFFLGGIYAMQLKVSVIGIVYKKILTLNRRSLIEVISGQTINLVSNDANRLKDAGWCMMFLLFAPMEIISSGILLWHLIGWQALVGAGFFLIVVTYISVLSKKAGKLREKAASVTDERLAIMNEVISGIRAVKLNAWEWNFRDMIRHLRKKEISFIRLRGAILSSFDALYFTNTPIAGFISVTTLLLTNNYLTAFQIFTLLSALNVIKFSVSVSVGETLHLLADVKVSLDRIQNFLETHSSSVAIENPKHKTNNGCDNPNFDCRHFEGAKDNCPEIENVFMPPEENELSESSRERNNSESRISLKNVSCSWNETDDLKTLQNISIEIGNKQLVAITGPVGCGKTSLLQAILRELPCRSGEIAYSGSIAYVPQLPWVFSGTVQENITFGKSLDTIRYQQILQACSLGKDLQQFSKGDFTQIGQRGVSLSGGQQARVCLARALYTDANIFLLDDPFSAVDVQVGSHLFKECILGLLSEKTCVLVTHQHQFLAGVDTVFVMEQGTIACHGKYNELQDKDVLSKIVIVEKAKERRESVSSGRYLQRTLTSISLVLSTDERAHNDLKEEDEDRMVGSVTWRLYWHYFRSAFPAVLLFWLFFLVLLVQAFLVSPYWWLSQIANMPFSKQRDAVTLGIYGSLVIGTLLLTTIVSFFFFYTLLRASQNLHDKMTTAVIKSPVIFFDTNSAGRILNRFSKDIGCMDDQLPPQFLHAVQLCLFSLGATLLSAATNYWLVIGITPLVLLFLYFGRYYLKTSRELKRLEAIKCSPVYAHISDTVAGLEVIRSSGMENSFLQELFRYQDQNTPANIMVLGCSKWLGVRLEVLCSVLVTLVATGAVLVTQIPAIAGMSLTYALETLDAAQFGIQLTSETENLMTSVERVVKFTQISPEPGYKTKDERRPAKGNLCLRNLSLTYVQGSHRVLRDITLEIKDKEKVGITGRTGSGKSSLVAALLRMPEPDGEVMVDGINLKTLNLQEARRTFSVITQNPILFTGSLRRNLDPFNKHTDLDLWTALEDVQMKHWALQLPGHLQYKLIESGSNLSVGERQLVCLARVLLQNNKIVVLDEATANVDFKTDRLIQEVIRTKLNNVTVLTIAHRLDTIVDYDRVMVLDKGRVVEFDKPSVLLNEKGSCFADLVKSYNTTVSS